MVAQVGAQPLFLAYSGIDSARASSPQAHQRSFYPQNPTVYFYYVAYRYWMLKPRFGGGQFLSHFGTHLLDIFPGKLPRMHISPTAGSFHLNFFK